MKRQFQCVTMHELECLAIAVVVSITLIANVSTAVPQRSQEQQQPALTLTQRQTSLDLTRKSKDASAVSRSSQFHHQMPSVVPTVSVTCEGRYLSLTCDGMGHVLKIKRALFGRITPVQCVKPDQEDVIANIMCGLEDDSATEIVAHRCNGRVSCDLHASTTVFNDACPGIYKYLEINYECSPPDITTTSTPVPTEPAPITSTTAASIDADTIIPTTVETSNEVIYPTPDRPKSSTTDDDSLQNESPSPSANALPSIAHTSRPQPVMCFDYTTERRDIPVGRVVRQTCPRGGLGVQVSVCGEDGELEIISDETDCVSPWVSFMEQRIVKGNESAQSLTQDLILRTSWSQDLTGGDIRKTTEFVSTLTKHLKQSCVGKPKTTVKKEALDFAEKIFTVGDNVLKQDSWDEVASLSRKSTVMDLVDGLESSAFFLADAMLAFSRPDDADMDEADSGSSRREKGTTSVTQVIPRPNVVLEVQVSREAPNGAGGDAVFPTSGYPAAEKMGEKIVVSKRTVDALRDHRGEIRLVFAAYDRVTSIINNIRPPPEITNDGDDHVISKPVAPTPETKQSGNWTVNSRVLTASVNEANGWTPVKDPVHITFLNDLPVSKDAGRRDDAVRCVYWDYASSSSSSSHSSSSSGRWSSDGCRLVSSNETHTECACDHLTNFAVLMDFNAVFIDLPDHEIKFAVITYAGCVISIVSLFLAFITFSLLSNLQCARNTIHKNLCFCLLVAELIFIIGIRQTDVGFLCSAIAVLLHYFFLAAFAWMCLEGVQLYVMLVQVFEAERSKTKWYYAVGYGFPLVIVGISIVVSELLYDSTRYGTESFCWLTHRDGFTFAFVGPVVVVLFLNIIFLSIAMYQMCKHAGVGNPAMSKNGAPKNGVHSSVEGGQKHQRRHVGISSWIKGSAVLVVLLGLTWITGLFFVHRETVIMAYVFTVLNSFQGLFIFLFHCVFNEKVRKEYVKFVRRSSWIPDCVKICCTGRATQWSTNPSASPHSSSNSSSAHVWRWLDVRAFRGRQGQKNNGHNGVASPNGDLAGNSVGNSASLNRPILARENASLNSIADNGGFESLAPYERDMRQLSSIDASVVDSEAVSEYMQNHFHSPPTTSTNVVDESARASSQLSQDADDYLAPVSCSNTPTPIPLGAPPAFYVGSAAIAVDGSFNEEPLYHEIPENHVYAILEPPTLKSKWRPISTLLHGKESPTVCSTLPALRAPQPPTAPPPEDGVVTLINNKPDVTLCGNEALGAIGRQMSSSAMPAALMSSFRKSPSKDLETIRLSKFHPTLEEEPRCMTSSPSSIHNADVIESHIKASPSRQTAQSHPDLSLAEPNGFYPHSSNGCCSAHIASVSSLASMTLPPGLNAPPTGFVAETPSMNAAGTNLSSVPPSSASCVPSCAHAHSQQHHQHTLLLPHSHPHLPQFSRATTLPCGVDPRLLARPPVSSSSPSTSPSPSACLPQNHAVLSRSSRADLTAGDAAAASAASLAAAPQLHPSVCLGHHQHLHNPQAPASTCCPSYNSTAAAVPVAVSAAPICHSPACCADSAAVAIQQHQQMQQQLQHQMMLQEAARGGFVPGSYNVGSSVPSTDSNVWSVAQQMRMPSGRPRAQERDSGLGTSHILSESTLSMEQSEPNMPSDTSDEELAQLTPLAASIPLQQHQGYHQYTNDLQHQQSQAMPFGSQPQHFQMKPSCKL